VPRPQHQRALTTTGAPRNRDDGKKKGVGSDGIIGWEGDSARRQTSLSLSPLSPSAKEYCLCRTNRCSLQIALRPAGVVLTWFAQAVQEVVRMQRTYRPCAAAAAPGRRNHRVAPHCPPPLCTLRRRGVGEWPTSKQRCSCRSSGSGRYATAQRRAWERRAPPPWLRRIWRPRR